LNSNAIGGELREEWSALFSLEKLLLDNNAIEGTLPVSISAMAGLHNL
jgi:hypothetical protein